ncbi:hypothetical protein BDN70DRAFT_940179 [Pholiota conissans]|uniref:Peptidase S53 domain-containing protein n=1 Tax=Pholiota conissans TaxID=109636 RepID=A0A9P5YHK5_9AGAR|nr:hypothetical protein BDN70DRAFT_940179 [Pholiota conissans]
MITLGCLAEIYNYTNFYPKVLGGDKNKIGITGYLDGFANFQDLQTFFADQLPQAVNSTFEVELVNGGSNSQDQADAGIEANLDVQFALGVSFPTPGLFWSTGGSPPFIPDNQLPENTNEPYWLDFVLSQWSLPTVISSSYGDDEQTVPESYARHACMQFAQLAARGVSVIVSSGDFGVGGIGGADGNPADQSF